MAHSENTIEHLSSRLLRGETTARAVVVAALDAAEEINETLNAFLQIDRAGAMARANEIAAETGNGAPRGALAGIPIVLKDNICVRGLQASCGSRILGD
ncbi:MAG TPA: amidase family protein, partial [Pyrinomonadaceae bacterium]|nr:amidase family protein [Pyrinomonadaceae bacterium]